MKFVPGIIDNRPIIYDKLHTLVIVTHIWQ